MNLLKRRSLPTRLVLGEGGAPGPNTGVMIEGWWDANKEPGWRSGSHRQFRR